MTNWTTRKEEISNIPLPQETNTYKPIAHSVFVTELERKIQEKGLEICNQKFLTTGNGQVLTGEYHICPKNEDKDMGLGFSFANSYNKQIKVEILAGAYIKVCSNGMYGSAVRYSKKHTGDVVQQLEDKINFALDQSERYFEYLINQKNRLKEIEVSKKVIAELVGDLYLNDNTITATQLSIIKNEMSFSSNFKEKTAYSVYNWVTEAFKSTHPTIYTKNHAKLNDYFVDRFNLPIFELNPILEEEEFVEIEPEGYYED